jgi:hypothetical protein
MPVSYRKIAAEKFAESIRVKRDKWVSVRYRLMKLHQPAPATLPGVDGAAQFRLSGRGRGDTGITVFQAVVSRSV